MASYPSRFVTGCWQDGQVLIGAECTEHPEISQTQKSAGATSDQSRLGRLDKLARLLDTALPIPGTRFRIGLDGLLGLIPGVGDKIGAVFSAYIILEGARLGFPKGTLLRMIGNVAVETVVGAVPILGDVFDIAWKANVRNLAPSCAPR